MDYDFEIGRMKETLALCLRSEQRLAEVQQHHSESIATLARINAALGQSMLTAAERIAEHEVWLQKVERNNAERVLQAERDKAESEARWKHIDMTIAEIGDKLNGLIGYMDGQNSKQ